MSNERRRGDGAVVVGEPPAEPALLIAAIDRFERGVGEIGTGGAGDTSLPGPLSPEARRAFPVVEKISAVM